jgi:hypothetical protein
MQGLETDLETVETYTYSYIYMIGISAKGTM